MSRKILSGMVNKPAKEQPGDAKAATAWAGQVGTAVGEVMGAWGLQAQRGVQRLQEVWACRAWLKKVLGRWHQVAAAEEGDGGSTAAGWHTTAGAGIGQAGTEGGSRKRGAAGQEGHRHRRKGQRAGQGQWWEIGSRSLEEMAQATAMGGAALRVGGRRIPTGRERRERSSKDHGEQGPKASS